MIQPTLTKRISFAAILLLSSAEMLGQIQQAPSVSDPLPRLLDYKDRNGINCYDERNFDSQKKTIVFFHGFSPGGVQQKNESSMRFPQLGNDELLSEGWNDFNFVLSNATRFMDITPYTNVVEVQEAIWSTPKRWKKSGDPEEYAENNGLIPDSLCEYFAKQYKDKYANRVSNDVWFVGHSLGFQLATCVAAHLWRDSKANSQTARAHLPKNLIGLGVYFSGTDTNYFDRWFPGKKIKKVHHAIHEMVKELKEDNVRVGVIRTEPKIFLAAHRLFVEKLPGIIGAGDAVSNLAAVYTGVPATELMQDILYQEVLLNNRLDKLNDTEKRYIALHFAAIYYFFKSKGWHPEIGWSAETFEQAYDKFAGQGKYFVQTERNADSDNVRSWEFTEVNW